MKRIAFMSDGWHRLISYVTMNSMRDTFSDYEEDVILCQFNCFGNWSRDEKYNKGEYNIYSLPDLSQFDGVVLDINTIIDMAQVENLIRISKSAGIPVVTIGFEVDGCYYSGIDNKRPIYEMMDHLYSVHKCRSFVFAGGPLSNSENALRTQAYREFLNLYGLSSKENPVLIGEFDFMTGCRHFDTMIDKHIPIPDAFVCANDNIAAGLISEAFKYGYKVPEDFLVTGFDDLDKASYFSPQISTIGFDRERIGELCAKIFKQIWRGEEPKQCNYIDLDYFYTESCGCPSRTDVDYRTYSCNNIISNVQLEINEAQLLEFESRIVKCKEFDEIFKQVGDFFRHMECDEVYFFIDERLYEANPVTRFPKSGYDWNYLKMVFAIEDRIKSRFKGIIDVIGHLEQEGRNNCYLFTPIHFGDQTIGFSIVKNAGFLDMNTYFYDVHSTIVKVLNNLFTKKQLENANKNLNELYIKDAMTGVYNRIAFTDKIIPSLKKLHKNNIPCAIAFVDTDNFKMINDEFGHGYGDRVLKIIASTLERYCPEEGFVCRYGGDEFVIFFPQGEEQLPIDEYKEKVKKSLSKENISISMGTIVSNPLSAKDFDEYIQEADHIMYEEKQNKKAGR